MNKVKLNILILMIAVVLCTGCSGNGDTQADTQSKAVPEQYETAGTEIPDSSLATEERVALLIGEMTLEEKAGQMIQGGRDVITGEEITRLHLGSVLSGGGSYPGGNTLKDWNEMVMEYQSAAMNTKHRIPMLYGVDAVHGLALIPGAVVFPQNIGLGAADDPELMYRMGAAVAEEMKLAGILWNFSPCVAVSADPRWGRTYECYSSDPAIVTSLAGAYVKGQADHGVVPTIKHYAADGGTAYGSGPLNGILDEGDVRISEEELRTIHLAPYKALVQSGAKIVMASFSSCDGIGMHENKYLLTDVLKGEFGFKGFVVSDWEAVQWLSGTSYKENVALAVNAGIDMLMEPFEYERSVNTIISCVKDGSIPQKRIDDAVSRILTVKFDLGVFEDPYSDHISHEVTELGSPGYRELAKRLVEKSLVLLKNDGNLLPLKKGQKIFVTGPAMNDVGLQCGGWGLTWQGQLDEDNDRALKGTTILEGLQSYTQKQNIEMITDKNRAEEADAVILALGEIPYAEYQGDTRDLSITGALGHPGNKKAIEFVKSLGKPVITLLVAGRNVIISEYMDDWDSIVMCYLPGTEGDGIASVLAGDALFTGKLPMPYYKSTEDIGNHNAKPLFPIGFGLTY